MSIFSIVTVRKGSQGLKDKCMRKLDGKAVFEYTIEYSIDLDSMTEEEVFTVVSSDSDMIREYCSENNICFLKRSLRLASDVARIEDVIYDAYRKTGKDFDYISLLYGNIPIRYPGEFLKAYNFLLENKDYDAVISMQNVEKFNPAWMFDLNEDILPVKKIEGYRRQDLKQLMIHDGHTILFRTKHFLEFMKRKSEQSIMYEAFGKKIKPMLNDKLIIDIDTKRDLKVAEAVLKFGVLEGK
jgi:CMP-N-acetylneuraminic acid synthetase